MIYLDNAATSYHKPESVYEAVIDTMRHSGNCDRGVNFASLSSGRVIYETRALLAELFNAEDPSRIAFTSNSTESLNIAIRGLFHPGDHVISTVLEHNSVLRPLYEIQKDQVEVSFIGCDKAGNLLYQDLEMAIRPETKAIICTHASNLTGNLIDIDRIGRLAKKYDLLLVVDASQTAGVFEIDVQRQNISVLCFTGHKSLLGPQGTGGIYVREGVKIRPFKTGGSGVLTYSKTHPDKMPTLLEAGTLNTPGIAGLGEGVRFILQTTTKAIQKRENALMMRFYSGIQSLPHVTVYGDFTASRRCPVVTLNIDDYTSAEVGDILSTEYDIAVRTGGHCAPKMHEALGTVESGAVRFSFSFFNTEEEVDAAILAIRDIISDL